MEEVPKTEYAQPMIEVWVKNEQRGILPDTVENRQRVAEILRDENPYIRKYDPNETRSPAQISTAMKLSGMLQTVEKIDPEKVEMRKMMAEMQKQIELLTANQNTLPKTQSNEHSGTISEPSIKGGAKAGQRKGKSVTSK